MINRDDIRSKIQQILNKAHTEGPKKVIKENPDGLQFADPIGGDSSKNPYTKRAHLYWNSFYVVCYDDEGYKMPFTKFCNIFGVDIDPEQRMEIYDHIDQNISYSDYEDDFMDSTFDNLISLEELQESLNSGNSESQVMNLKPLQEGSRVEWYLRKRGIPNTKNIFQADFYKTSDWIEPVIVFMNRRDDKILGMQVRNLKEGYKRMFKVYNYEQLLEWVNPDKKGDIDINEVVMYNKLSYYYNILNVNFNSTITIFEGYLDSIFFPNSIGIVGVNTDLRFLENNNLDIRYFFDNDHAGYKKSSEKIDRFPVFLWNKLFEDIVNKKNTKDPYSLYNRIKKVKDLNKLAEIIKDPYRKLKLDEYFSKDEFDKRYIPKTKPKWRNGGLNYH